MIQRMKSMSNGNVLCKTTHELVYVHSSTYYKQHSNIFQK